MSLAGVFPVSNQRNSRRGVVCLTFHLMSPTLQTSVLWKGVRARIIASTDALSSSLEAS